ncbi:MAG: hypothetical protein WBC71_12480 [Salaquimonas sp.]
MKTIPNIGLIGFETYQASIFSANGLNICGHIYVGKPETAGTAGNRIVSFETFKKFEFGNSCSVNGAETLDNERQEAFDLFVRCVDRWDWSKEMIHDWSDYQHLFSAALSNASAWLEATKPEALVFSNVPHQGAIIVLFYVARARGIATHVFLQSHFPGKSWAFDHWTDLGPFHNTRPNTNFEVDITPPKEQPFYMKSVRSEFSRSARAFASGVRARAVVFFGLTGLNQIQRRASFNRNIGRIKKEAENLNYFRKAKRFFSADIDEIEGKDFVYFPFHLQPEMTTDVLGGAFSDQALALEKLCRVVPENIAIVVKENPKQRSQMRSEAFFDRLSRRPNLIAVHRNTSSFELINKAKCVATVTGTAGWEALRMGKPVICFGHIYWNSLPGVFRYQDSLTWKELSSFQFDSGKLQISANQLGRFCYDGDVDKVYSQNREGFDPKQNAKALAQSIKHMTDHTK